MTLVANIVIAIIGLLHVYFLVLEMFLWDKSAKLGQISSSAMAVASPPPMHKVAMPRLPPRALSACNKVTMMRAPLAPMG